MLINNRKIWIYWRNIKSSYAAANEEGLDEPSRNIGSSISGVQKMLSNSEEQIALMSSVISISPGDSGWAKALSKYWQSLSEEILPTGKELEIGFIYDSSDLTKMAYITNINDKLPEDKKLETDEDIKNYVAGRLLGVDVRFKTDMAKANKLAGQAGLQAKKTAYDIKYDLIWKIEAEHYKFGTPINVSDYLLYKYCMVYSQVANELSLAEKSPNIRFYLHSEAEIKLAKERKHKADKDRMNVYIDTIKSVSKVENVLYALNKGDKVRSIKDDTDLFILLEEVSKDRPAAFVAAAKDKNLVIKGTIEKYIATGILRRLDNTQIVVDATDPGIITGNSLEEAVSYFASKKNEAIVSEYNAKYKGLPK